ncbi:MAG: carboxymuconolactone decarboxylase family protein [Thermodesulfobacteriota bacterium]|nr:carboxymuconolactone decarboxylase family protein [Thermodesulfobacteriota bacterium]
MGEDRANPKGYFDVLGEKFRVFYGMPPEESLAQKAESVEPNLKADAVKKFHDKRGYPWWVVIDAGHPMTADLDPLFIENSIGAVEKMFDSPILPYTTKELILHACCMTAHFAVYAHLYPLALEGYTLDQLLEAIYVIHWAAGMMTMADVMGTCYTFLKERAPKDCKLEDTYTHKLMKSTPDKTTEELLAYFGDIYGSDLIDEMGWTRLAELSPDQARNTMFRWYALRGSQHLDVMTKELMTFAVGTQLRDSTAMKFHLKGAIEAGAAKAQLLEAIGLALAGAGNQAVGPLMKGCHGLLKDLP